MASVRLEQISKQFGQTTALSAVDLSIDSGELFFLLGPSGCGKSTLLRIIAGLHEPTAGKVIFDGKDVTALPTEKRNAVMCFQSYALWPHMTVEDNVRFGLEVRKASAAEQADRVAEVLRLVQMESFAHRKPNQLSGGQQQRVALARAMAVRPDCLLLDEPLSNLDAQLRLEMRGEIRRICKSAGLTTIYVTHDQKEALSIADRIAILNNGQLAQVGTPDELYHRPNSAFVAQFIGQTNLLRGTVLSQNADLLEIQTSVGVIRAKSITQWTGEVTLSIRPEQIRITRDAGNNETNRMAGTAQDTTFLGEASEHTLLVNGQLIKFISTPPMFHTPENLAVTFEADDVVILRN